MLVEMPATEYAGAATARAVDAMIVVALLVFLAVVVITIAVIPVVVITRSPGIVPAANDSATVARPAFRRLGARDAAIDQTVLMDRQPVVLQGVKLLA